MKYKKVPLRDFTGIFIPARIWDNRNLNPTDIILLGHINSFIGQGVSLAISTPDLSHLLRTDRKATVNSISNLTKHGMILATVEDGLWSLELTKDGMVW